MNSFFSPKYSEQHYKPIVYAYYDRPDMPATTLKNEPMHRHALCEIMYVTDGNTCIQAGNDYVPLRRHQFIWLDAGVPHRNILAPEPNGMMNIEFNLEACAPSGLSLRGMRKHNATVDKLLARPTDYFVLDDLDGAVCSLLKQTICLADSEHAQATQLCSMLTSMLLLLLARRRHSKDPSLDTTVDNPHINEALRSIHARYDEHFSIEQLAAEQNLNPSYFSALFKETLGKTPAQYIQALRMKQAEQLLTTTDYSILRIATTVGYSGQQHFSHIFRRHTGLSPSAYRRSFRESPE